MHRWRWINELSLIYDAYMMACIDEDGSMCFHWYMMHRWRWINVLSLIYDAYIDWCIDEYRLMCFHWYMMHIWIDALMYWLLDHVVMHGINDKGTMSWWCVFMGYSSWIDVNMTHYCLVMVDRKYKWMNSKVVPLWWKPSWEDTLLLSYPRSMVREPMINYGIMRWR